MDKIVFGTTSQKGFSLFEVLISLVLFALFITAYTVGFGTNVQNSARLDEEYRLHRLTEEILQNVIIDPPEFTESLTLAPVSKTFEETQFSDYEYTIEYQRLEIPDLAKIQGVSEEEEQAEGQQGQSQSAQKKVFNQLKKNLEEMIWQVKVSVKNKTTDFSYSLSTYLQNDKAKVNINFQ
jgi:prepilin-type N-terminal cleavage/methylation domain-containing protein